MYMKKLYVIGLILTVLILLTGCGKANAFEPLDGANIKSAVMYTQGNGSRELSKEEIMEFVRLYNSAEYAGEKTGGEPSAYFSIGCKFYDSDRKLSVRDAGGSTVSADGLLLKSEELHAFMERLYEELKAG